MRYKHSVLIRTLLNKHYVLCWTLCPTLLEIIGLVLAVAINIIQNKGLGHFGQLQKTVLMAQYHTNQAERAQSISMYWEVLFAETKLNRCEHNFAILTPIFKRTLSPYFRNLPLLHITIRLHLTSRLLKFMQWLARKQYVLRSW